MTPDQWWREGRDEIKRLRARIAELEALVAEQANDEGLWFQAETCAEAYVQQALRKLHAVIEGVSPDECAYAALAKKEKE